jgi:hypothetical protein
VGVTRQRPSIFITVLFSPTTWLPLEAIESADDSVAVGYVLKTESNVLTVLRDSPREVIRVEVDSLVLRGICQRPRGQAALNGISQSRRYFS